MDDIKELREQAAKLIERADRLEAGEPLCNHHWSGDPGYECYCPGCDKHIAEVRSIHGVPFKKDAYCSSCRSKGKSKGA